jgi:hypothetical protein
MPINRLYDTWKRRIMELRPGQRITQIRNFVWLIVGIYQSRSVYLSRIAGKVPGRAKLLSMTRRLSRLLANPAIRVREWYEPIAREWLEKQWHNAGEIHLIVDGTKIGFGHQLLIVCLAYRKRAIPIAWTWIRHIRGHSSAAKQLALLGYVRKLVPTGAAIFLVGDCEFGAVAVLRQLDQWQWVYALRQKSDTLIFLNPAQGWQSFGSYISRPGQSIWLGRGDLTAKEIYPTNLLVHWKAGEKEPWCLATNLPDRKMTLRFYRFRMWIEIVFTQMTKMDVFARRTGRDHVSDLNISIFDNHPVNEQFYQFPFLFEVSIVQPDLDTAAEILDRSCQASEFVLSVYLMDKLLSQVFHALTLAIQIGSSALVLGQRDDTVQVSLGKPVQLGLKGDLSTAQVFASGLQLLGKPVVTLRSLQSSGDDLGMCQHLTQIVPDQLIQLVGWDVSSKTTMVEMGVNRIRLSPTYIICIAGVQLVRCAAEVASTTAHQTPQQVGMGSVVAAGNLLVVRQFGLDLLKLQHLNNGGNICNRDPFFRGDWRMAPIWPANGMGGRTAQARLDHAGTSYVNSTGIRGIDQNTSCGGCAPVFATLGCRDPHFIQMLDQTIQRCIFLQIKGKHLTHDRRFRFVDRNFGGISGTIWINLKPINRFGPGQQYPGPVFRLTPTTHPIGNQGTFVFCHRTSDLQHQLVMGILADWAIQKLDLTTIFLPFFQQQHLVNIVAGQTIRLGHHKAINLSGCDFVSQSVQTRSIETSAAMTVISKDVLPRQFPSLLLDIGHQPLQLLFDRLGLGLAQGRDPCINRYSHVVPPGSVASGSLRPSGLSPALRERLGPIGSVRWGIPVLPDRFSTGVSWLPPHSDSSDAEYTFCSVAEARNRNGRRQWFSCN